MLHSNPGNKANAVDVAAIAYLRTLGGSPLVRQVITLFLQHGPRGVNTAIEAQRTGDLQALKKAAHSLKGSASYLGARDLQALTAAIEERAESREPGALDTLVAGLPTQFARVREELEAIKVELVA